MEVLRNAQKMFKGRQTRKNEKFGRDTRNPMQRRREMEDKRTTNTAELSSLNKNISKTDRRNFNT